MNVVDASRLCQDNAGKDPRTGVKKEDLRSKMVGGLKVTESKWCGSSEDNEHVPLFILR